jgi:6-phosphogluconate dehydrogenase (decarboxylating)
VVLDGGNENYRNTERRQRECEEIGVSWIGMGVSGGPCVMENMKTFRSDLPSRLFVNLLMS